MARFNIKARDIAKTPKDVFDALDSAFNVDSKSYFDPCPYNDPNCPDGLTLTWPQRVFCNPPFSKAVLWVEKALEAAKLGTTTIMILPWYHAQVGIISSSSILKRGYMSLPNVQAKKLGAFKFKFADRKPGSVGIFGIKIVPGKRCR